MSRSHELSIIRYMLIVGQSGLWCYSRTLRYTRIFGIRIHVSALLGYSLCRDIPNLSYAVQYIQSPHYKDTCICSIRIHVQFCNLYTSPYYMYHPSKTFPHSNSPVPIRSIVAQCTKTHTKTKKQTPPGVFIHITQYTNIELLQQTRFPEQSFPSRRPVQNISQIPPPRLVRPRVLNYM